MGRIDMFCNEHPCDDRTIDDFDEEELKDMEKNDSERYRDVNSNTIEEMRKSMYPEGEDDY